MLSLRIFLTTLLLACACCVAAQPGVWTWMHGSTMNNALGNFGTQGVAAPTNDPPALYEAAAWTDLNGNFWVMGGYSANNLQNALWKFDPVTNMWTWMKGPSLGLAPGVYGTQGVPSPANYPGARAYGMATWTDSQNNLWLFGGHGIGSTSNGASDLNDLWKYTIATNEWTWVSGTDTINTIGSYGQLQVPASGNIPPPRCVNACYTDANDDLWLFGGWSFSTANYGSCFADVWRYNIATNTWTWMAGSDTLDAPPVYGSQGITAPSNTPGGRAAYAHWKDTKGNFWIFGGSSYAALYADFWKYDPTTNTWTWMAGSDVPNDTAGFSAHCSTGNEYPRSANDNATNWVDGCGRFWAYSGWHFSTSNNYGVIYDDMWVFDPGTNLCTHVSGNEQTSVANYGTQLVPSPSNYPGSCAGGCSFTDLQGNFWMLSSSQSYVSLQMRNALWKYVPDTSCVKYFSTTTLDACAGEPLQLTTGLDPGYVYSWNFGDPANPGAASAQNLPVYTYQQAGTYTVTLTYAAPLSTCLAPDIDTFVVNVRESANAVTFPNVFTPNGDGNNDLFRAFVFPQEEYHLEVFDRWGKKIFETDDALSGWNGKSGSNDCGDGVYFWTATLNDCTGAPVKRSGFVHLVR